MFGEKGFFVMGTWTAGGGVKTEHGTYLMHNGLYAERGAEQREWRTKNL